MLLVQENWNMYKNKLQTETTEPHIFAEIYANSLEELETLVKQYITTKKMSYNVQLQFIGEGYYDLVILQELGTNEIEVAAIRIDEILKRYSYDFVDGKKLDDLRSFYDDVVDELKAHDEMMKFA